MHGWVSGEAESSSSAVGLGLLRWDRLLEPGNILDKASIINITIQNPGCKAHVPPK